MAATVEALPQHLVALRLANEVRSRRTQLKREVRAGYRTLLSALPDPACESLALGEALKWQRFWGDARVRRVCARIEIRETRPIGALTERQWRLLAEVLAE